MNLAEQALSHQPITTITALIPAALYIAACIILYAWLRKIYSDVTLYSANRKLYKNKHLDISLLVARHSLVLGIVLFMIFAASTSEFYV